MDNDFNKLTAGTDLYDTLAQDNIEKSKGQLLSDEALEERIPNRKAMRQLKLRITPKKKKLFRA